MEDSKLRVSQPQQILDKISANQGGYMLNCYSAETRESFHKYYRQDFDFLARYIFEFKRELAITVDNALNLYYRKIHIARISLKYSDNSIRKYKITFHPGFVEVPDEQGKSSNDLVSIIFREFRTESNYDYSVTVGPELLHFWCHKLIWDALNTIGYKNLH